MKVLLFFLACLISMQSALAEFSDPMRPPEYALKKFRLEKIKKTKPVVKKSVQPVKKESWVLNSILYSSHRQHAIINNQLVKEGEIIKGAKVIRLKADSVRLLSKGKIIDLTLYDAQNKIKSIKKSLNEKRI